LKRLPALISFLLVLVSCTRPIDTAILATNAATVAMADAKPRIESSCEGTEGTPAEKPCLKVAEAFNALLDMRIAAIATIKAAQAAEALGQEQDVAKLLKVTSDLAAAMRLYADAYHTAARLWQ
jgi:hypothetical protein